MAGSSEELDKIEAEAADLDGQMQGEPDPEEKAGEGDAPGEAPSMSPAAQQKTAYMALNGVTKVIGTFTGIKYPPEMIEQGAEHIAPLMSKPWARRLLGGNEGPTFLEQYNEEIQAGMWFAGFAVYTWHGVRAGRAMADYSKAVEEEIAPGQPDQDPDAPPPVSGGVWDELANDNV